MTTPAKRCVIYRRASLDATGEERSVDRQEEACRRHADARGWTVIGVETDNSISAYRGKKRPGWEAVLRLIETGKVDLVLAWHFDRMTRSMVDLEKLIVLAEAHNIGIATVSGDIDLTTDVGRMVARILAAVARAEVERKAARQRLGNQQQAASGKPWSGGARPFGYTPDQLHVVEAEAAAIREAARQVLAGVPLGRIAKLWDAAGLVSSRASEDTEAGWSPRGVRGVLLSPRYAGIRTYLGTEMGKGSWPVILPVETHLALRAKLQDPVRRMSGKAGGRATSNLLSLIARCSVCQSPVNGSSYRGVETYTCKPHQHLAATRTVVDEWVTAKMIALLSAPNALSLLSMSGDTEVDLAREQVNRGHVKLAELQEAYDHDAITITQLTTGTRAARELIAAADQVLASATAGPALDSLDLGTSRVAQQWQDLLLEQQRTIVKTFLDVELSPVGGGRRSGFDPERHMAIRLRTDAAAAVA